MIEVHKFIGFAIIASKFPFFKGVLRYNIAQIFCNIQTKYSKAMNLISISIFVRKYFYIVEYSLQHWRLPLTSLHRILSYHTYTQYFICYIALHNSMIFVSTSHFLM